MAVERVQSDEFPYLPIKARVHDREFSVMALLDTGFDGEVVIPLASIANGQPPDEYRTWILADGSEVESPIYYGTVQLGSLPAIDADVAGLGDEPIIGRGVSDHYQVILDHGERLIVEP